MTTRIFSPKAARYHRYRWEYAPEAIAALFSITGLHAASTVADLGAGTGRLTKHLAGKVSYVCAIEPNPDMLAFAKQTVRGIPGALCVLATAEATGLPRGWADVVTVGQAIHWFEREPARREILRILKPGGWLCLLRNLTPPSAYEDAVNAMMTEENGVKTTHPAPGANQPVSYYYGFEPEVLRFSFTYSLTWEELLGSVTSASPTPDDDHPLYPRFERALRDVFDRFAQPGTDGVLRVTDQAGETELTIGRPV